MLFFSVVRQNKLQGIAISDAHETLAEGHVPALVDRVIQRKRFAKMGVQAFLIANSPTASKCHRVQRRSRILHHEIERAASHALVHGLE